MKRNHKFKVFFGFMIFFLLTLLPSLTISAEEDETSQLQQKIVTLENRIKQLEAMLEECNRQVPPEPNPTGWRNKKNWRRLEQGMDMEEVQSILGKPVKTIQGVRTLWYYPSNYCGYVSFDKEGNLIGWNEP
jgi:hypothetical protein